MRRKLNEAEEEETRRVREQIQELERWGQPEFSQRRATPPLPPPPKLPTPSSPPRLYEHLTASVIEAAERQVAPWAHRRHTPLHSSVPAAPPTISAIRRPAKPLPMPSPDDEVAAVLQSVVPDAAGLASLSVHLRNLPHLPHLQPMARRYLGGLAAPLDSQGAVVHARLIASCGAPLDDSLVSFLHTATSPCGGVPAVCEALCIAMDRGHLAPSHAERLLACAVQRYDGGSAALQLFVSALRQCRGTDSAVPQHLFAAALARLSRHSARHVAAVAGLVGTLDGWAPSLASALRQHPELLAPALPPLVEALSPPLRDATAPVLSHLLAQNPPRVLLEACIDSLSLFIHERNSIPHDFTNNLEESSQHSTGDPHDPMKNGEIGDLENIEGTAPSTDSKKYTENPTANRRQAEIERLRHYARCDGRANVRARAIRALGKDWAPLTQAFHDPSAGVRAAALETLRGHPCAVRRAVHHLQDRSPAVRRRAADILRAVALRSPESLAPAAHSLALRRNADGRDALTDALCALVRQVCVDAPAMRLWLDLARAHRDRADRASSAPFCAAFAALPLSIRAKLVERLRDAAFWGRWEDGAVLVQWMASATHGWPEWLDAQLGADDAVHSAEARARVLRWLASRGAATRRLALHVLDQETGLGDWAWEARRWAAGLLAKRERRGLRESRFVAAHARVESPLEPPELRAHALAVCVALAQAGAVRLPASLLTELAERACEPQVDAALRSVAVYVASDSSALRLASSDPLSSVRLHALHSLIRRMPPFLNPVENSNDMFPSKKDDPVSEYDVQKEGGVESNRMRNPPFSTDGGLDPSLAEDAWNIALELMGYEEDEKVREAALALAHALVREGRVRALEAVDPLVLLRLRPSTRDLAGAMLRELMLDSPDLLVKRIPAALAAALPSSTERAVYRVGRAGVFAAVFAQCGSARRRSAFLEAALDGLTRATQAGRGAGVGAVGSVLLGLPLAGEEPATLRRALSKWLLSTVSAFLPSLHAWKRRDSESSAEAALVRNEASALLAASNLLHVLQWLYPADAGRAHSVEDALQAFHAHLEPRSLSSLYKLLKAFLFPPLVDDDTAGKRTCGDDNAVPPKKRFLTSSLSLGKSLE